MMYLPYEKEPAAYADAFWLKPEMFSIENDMKYFDYDLNSDFIIMSDSFKTQWFIGGLSNYRLFLLQFLMYPASKEPNLC